MNFDCENIGSKRSTEPELPTVEKIKDNTKGDVGKTRGKFFNVCPIAFTRLSKLLNAIKIQFLINSINKDHETIRALIYI